MRIIKLSLIVFLVSSVCSCASKQEIKVNTVNTVKIGEVKQVIMRQVEKKPSLITVISGAALGGIIGHQFGNGDGKKIATGAGTVLGGIITDKSLTKKYNQIIYDIYIPIEKINIGIVSSDLKNNIFKNDVVVIYTKGKEITLDAYGEYSDSKHDLIQEKLKNGTLE